MSALEVQSKGINKETLFEGKVNEIRGVLDSCYSRLALLREKLSIAIYSRPITDSDKKNMKEPSSKVISDMVDLLDQVESLRKAIDMLIDDVLL